MQIVETMNFSADVESFMEVHGSYIYTLLFSECFSFNVSFTEHFFYTIKVVDNSQNQNV